MLRCPNCGYIDWDNAPALKETAEWATSNSPVTTRDVAERFDLSLQAAGNRLSRLARLDVLDKQREMQESGKGYIHYYYANNYIPAE